MATTSSTAPRVSIPRSYNEQEVSELTGTPVATLRHWRQRGGGPDWFKLGRRVRYEHNDLYAWFEAQRRATRRG